MGRNGSFEVNKLETGFLIRVCAPEKKEELYNNSSSGCQYVPPKEGAVSSNGEVLEAVSKWLETGDVDFKKIENDDKPKTLLGDVRDLNRYGQEPKIIPGT